MKWHRRKVFLTALVSILFLCTIFTQAGYAQVPQKINYQGYLTDSKGVPINGTRSILFSIYDVNTEGTSLWREERTVIIKNGGFSIDLGEVRPVKLSFDTQYYLGIAVEADAEMKPRQALTSVPYAFNVQAPLNLSSSGVSPTIKGMNAGTGTGGHFSSTSGYGLIVESGNVGIGTIKPAYQLDVNGNVNSAGFFRAANGEGLRWGGGATRIEGQHLSNTIDMFTAGSSRLRITSSGNVGIGTMNPTVKLDVDGGLGTAVYGLTSSGTGVEGKSTSGIGVKGIGNPGVYGIGTYGVIGESVSSAGRGVYGTASGISSTGVFGRSASSTGYGVYGWNTSTGTGLFGFGTIGVGGKSTSLTGYGVKGENTSTTGTTYGVYGISSSTGGYGVKGENTSATGTTFGVYGTSISSTGYGVKGENTSTGTGVSGESSIGIGVYGSSSSTGTGVYGINTSTGIGVKGYSSTGQGVYGESTTSGNKGTLGGINEGVWGASSSGLGVYGVSVNNTGVYGVSVNNTGVYGVSSIGTAGHFKSTSGNGLVVEGQAQITGNLTLNGKLGGTARGIPFYNGIAACGGAGVLVTYSTCTSHACFADGKARWYDCNGGCTVPLLNNPRTCNLNVAGYLLAP